MLTEDPVVNANAHLLSAEKVWGTHLGAGPNPCADDHGVAVERADGGIRMRVVDEGLGME